MKTVQKLFAILAGACVGGVFLITFAQVIQRYVFQLSMPWANDVIQILFTYSVFLGMAVGVFNRSHLNVDFLVQLFPEKAKPWFDVFSNIVILVFLSAVLFYSIRFVTDNMDQYMTYVQVPMSLTYAAIPITVCFMVVSVVLDLLRQFRGFAGGGTPQEGR